MRRLLLLAIFACLGGCASAYNSTDYQAMAQQRLEEKRLAVRKLKGTNGIPLADANLIAAFYCERFPLVGGATACTVSADTRDYWQATSYGGVAAQIVGVLKISKHTGQTSSSWGPSFQTVEALAAQ